MGKAAIAFMSASALCFAWLQFSSFRNTSLSPSAAGSFATTSIARSKRAHASGCIRVLSQVPPWKIQFSAGPDVVPLLIGLEDKDDIIADLEAALP